MREIHALMDFFLSDLSESAFLDAAIGLLNRLSPAFSQPLADAVADHFFREDRFPSVGRDFSNAPRRTDNANVRHLRSSLYAELGRLRESLAELDEVLASPGLCNPMVFLNKAKLLEKMGSDDKAATALSIGISLTPLPPFSFFVKAEKILERLIFSNHWSPRREVRLALLGSSTTSLFAPILKAIGFRREVRLDIYEGLFGDYRQKFSIQTRKCFIFIRNFVAIILNHRNLLASATGDPREVAGFCPDFRHLWETVQSRVPCHLIQLGLDNPGNGGRSML